MTASWRAWNRYDWSGRLLEHHFTRATGLAADVEFIDVSEDALAACAGAAPLETDEVRECFLDVISRSAAGGSPWTKLGGQSPPDWFAYLVAACHVFVDSDAADQNKCIEPMCDRLGETFGNGLEVMPDLWIRLEQWLAERPDQYRVLQLPEPRRGWNRIGHAVRIAFPRKNDQRAIGRALEAAGTADDPSLDKALAAVRSVRRDLTEPMQHALASFEDLLGSEATLERLFDTPLWSAVLSAGRAIYDTDRNHEPDLGILVFEEDERTAQIALVANEAPPGLGEAWLDDAAYPPWRYVCTDKDIIRDIFSGSIAAGRLGKLLASGIVPLVDSGYWELAPRNESKHATAQLRNASVSAAEDRARSTFDAMPTDWKLVTGIEPGAASTQVVRPQRRSARMVGGVRLGAGTYLNEPLVRPSVEAPWATSVLLEHAGTEYSLSQEHGMWELHVPRSISGGCRIVASDGASSATLEVTLAAEVAGLPKPVSNPDRWSIDGSGRARKLSSEQFASTIQRISSESRILLSANVGIGANSISDAAWAVTSVADKLRITLLTPDPKPAGRSAVKGDIRQWRQFLNTEPTDNQSADALKSVRDHVTRQLKDLPIVDGSRVERFSTRKANAPLDGAARVEAALAGITRTRSELRTGEIASFLHESSKYSLGDSEKWEQLRDLSEAGVVDIATYLQWGKRAVFAIPPTLVVHETAVGVTAVLSGLGTHLLRADLRRRANAIGIAVDVVDAIGPLVPPTLSLFAESLEQLRKLSAASSIPIAFLPSTPTRVRDIEDLALGLPEKYDTWGTSFEFESAPGAKIQLWRRADAPERYVVTVGEQSLQCRSRSTAELWAAVATDQLILEQADTEVVSNVPLPLTVARWAARLGGPRPGFDAKQRVHRYPTPNKKCAEIVISAVKEIVADENPWSEDD